ncbi:MAG: hypothetical protein AAGC49_11580 [Brevundimonas sp.]
MTTEQVDVQGAPPRHRAARVALVVAALVVGAAVVYLVWLLVYLATREDTAVGVDQPASSPPGAVAVPEGTPSEIAPGVFAPSSYGYDESGDADLGSFAGVPLRLHVRYLAETDEWEITPRGSALRDVVPMVSDDQGESTTIGHADVVTPDGTARLELANVPATLGFDARTWLWVDRDEADGGHLVRVPSIGIPSRPEDRDAVGTSLMYLVDTTPAAGIDPDDVTVVFDLPDGTVRAQDCLPTDTEATCEQRLGEPGFFDDFRAAQARWEATRD